MVEPIFIVHQVAGQARDERGGEASADHADRQRRGRYFAAARTPVPVDLISACRASTRALTVRVFDLC